MCEICRKYRCPDGCPNNYTPTRRPKRDRNIKRVWHFEVIHMADIAEHMQEKHPRASEKENKA